MRYVAAIAAVLLAAPIPTSAQMLAQPGTAPPQRGAVAAVMTAEEYIAAAAADDLCERTSSELVMRGEGGSPVVMRFAQKMVVDHQNLGLQLRTVAGAAGLRPGVPVMTPQQQTMIEQLQTATGAQRERIYLTQQAAAHQQALALHKGYAGNGDREDLRAAARMAAQVVEGHLLELNRLATGG